MTLTDTQVSIVGKYGKFFNNTGGNDIRELIERKGVNYFNNPLVAELQGCLLSQVLLVERLIDEGLLEGKDEDQQE